MAGIPDRVINLIKDMYKDSTTSLKIKGKLGPQIRILNGMKQGCPLSPFLFNLVLDSLLNLLQQREFGVDIGKHKINSLAFADDLVLVANSKYDMQALINIVSEFFDKLGMSLNPKKCESLRLARARHVKNMKLDTMTAFKLKNDIIRPCKFDKRIKYLGVQINHKGEIMIPRKYIEDTLANIKNARVRPEQRLRILRDHFIPKLAYMSKLALLPMSKLKLIDAIIRRWVFRVLHLPPSPIAFLYLPLRLGGLGLIQFSEMMPYRSYKSLIRMSTQGDEIEALVASSLLGKNEKIFAAARVHQADVKGWLNLYHEGLLDKFIKTAWGLDFAPLAKSSKLLSWLTSGKIFKGGLFIDAIQLISGNWPTRMALHRGHTAARPDMIKCRRCGANKETTAHILNECPYSHNLIIKRHDKIVALLCEHLRRNPNLEVHPETLFMVDKEGFRPDICVRDKIIDKVFVIEVMVPYDHSTQHLNSRYNFKLNKYNSITFKSEVSKKLLGSAGRQNDVRVLPVIVGFRGAITDITLKSLGAINMKHLAFKAQCSAISSSCFLFNQFRDCRVFLSRRPQKGGRRQEGGGQTSNTDGPAGRPPDDL